MPATVFAADLGGTKLSAALVDARGNIRARASEPVDTSSTNGPVEQIQRLAARLAGTGSLRRVCSAAGVAVPGLVRRDGTVWAPNLRGWKRVPLARLLRRRLGVPVAVESDRNAAVLGEVWRGAARGRSDVIVLMVGTGMGAGILSGGRLVRGAHELSGCAGWMVVTDERNPFTHSAGSLEALAAGPAIRRAAARAMRFDASLSAAEAAKAARRGRTGAARVFERAGRLLGLGVANLISLFDPEVVVLTGGLAGASDLYMKPLKKAVRQYAQPLSAPRVRILVSRLGGDANLLGAARLAFATADAHS